MSTSDKLIQNGNNGIQVVVFLTEADKKMSSEEGIRSKIWQILPVFVGSLMCLPFGLMLGWPSPTYPKLLAETTPIAITIDQSAMIAGFLMIGNILGTPISSWSILGTKYGIIMGLFSMLIGWLIMWYATNIYFLLGSRILVGLGCGYGTGQLKAYIKDLCQPEYSRVFLKLITFYVFFGVVAAFVLGCYTSFIEFSLVAMIITAVIFLFCFLLPHPPKEYLRYGKVREARLMLKYLKPNSDVDNEIKQMRISLTMSVEHMSFFQVLRDRIFRKYFAIMGLVTFFQQFSGAPATIIYTQIIFTASSTPFPEFWAIAYAVLFFVSNLLGVLYFSKFNHKNCLLISSVSVTLILALNIVVYYFNFNENYWNYISVISMFLFIFVHTIGLGVVPFILTQEYFPERARRVMSHFQIMQHSALALIITKIFQVLYDRFQLYVPFCLFICISLVCTFFVLIFVPHEPPVLQENGKCIKRSVRL